MEHGDKITQKQTKLKLQKIRRHIYESGDNKRVTPTLWRLRATLQRVVVRMRRGAAKRNNVEACKIK